MKCRPAEVADLARVDEIYNHYVRETPITFDVEPIPPAARREWLVMRPPAGPHRALVAEVDGTVLGYATSGPFRPKRAYHTTVETTVYLDPSATGRGIGSALYEALFDALRGEDVHRALAGITLPNPASIALHERFGFRRTGIYTEVGRKFGRYWDVAWYEKPLPHGTGG